MKHFKIESSQSLKLKSLFWRLRFKARPFLKRVMDIVMASTALLLLAPFGIVIALLIKIDSQGPVFFRQQRIGLNAVPFSMWKFRSMKVDAEQNRKALAEKNEMSTGVIFKMKQDPRITRIGTFIRKTSIDELPQLINVIWGDMSLVGPRPPLAEEVAQYTRSDRLRLTVLPGITCFWQVCGRSEVPFEQQVELDVQYIESQSVWLDLALILKTIPAVISARGAY